MAITFNNGSNPAEVKFHNQGTVSDITAVNFNGIQIWSKSAPIGSWQNAWSGMVYLFDLEELEERADSWNFDPYDFTHEFSGISVPDTTQYTIQADAEFYTFDLWNQDPNYAWSSDYLNAERNNHSETTNLPWNAYGYVSGTLDPLVQNGPSTMITAHSDLFFLWGSFIFGCFVVNNIWYYDK